MDDYGTINTASLFYYFIKIDPVTALVSGMLCDIIFCQTRVTCSYQDSATYTVNVKTLLESCKNKDGYLNIYSQVAAIFFILA